MTLNIDQGDVETTQPGEIKAILGTASSGGTYEDSGTVIVSTMQSDLTPVDEHTGEAIRNCNVSVPMLNVLGNTGAPASYVPIPTIGWELKVKINSDDGQINKRYYETEKEVDTSKDTIEMEIERAENIGNSL